MDNTIHRVTKTDGIHSTWSTWLDRSVVLVGRSFWSVGRSGQSGCLGQVGRYVLVDSFVQSFCRCSWSLGETRRKWAIYTLCNQIKQQKTITFTECVSPSWQVTSIRSKYKRCCGCMLLLACLLYNNEFTSLTGWPAGCNDWIRMQANADALPVNHSVWRITTDSTVWVWTLRQNCTIAFNVLFRELSNFVYTLLGGFFVCLYGRSALLGGFFVCLSIRSTLLGGFCVWQ